MSYTKPWVHLTCNWCGEDYSLVPYLAKRSRYCSHGCRLNALHEGNIGRGIKRDPGYTVDDNGCWLYNGHITDRGYPGYLTGDDGQVKQATRVYYERKYGPIESSLEPDHLCRVRGCVNPDHLEPVTHAVNSRRSSWTKLSEEKAEEIRHAIARGERQIDIAARYGVTNGTISGIKRGVTWVAV